MLVSIAVSSSRKGLLVDIPHIAARIQTIICRELILVSIAVSSSRIIVSLGTPHIVIKTQIIKGLNDMKPLLVIAQKQQNRI